MQQKSIGSDDLMAFLIRNSLEGRGSEENRHPMSVDGRERPSEKGGFLNADRNECHIGHRRIEC